LPLLAEELILHLPPFVIAAVVVATAVVVAVEYGSFHSECGEQQSPSLDEASVVAAGAAAAAAEQQLLDDD